MKPSWPISSTAWRGKAPARSHSAAKGLRRSLAKLRAVSWIIACSWDRIMALLLDGLSPCDRRTGVVVKTPGILRFQPRDHLPHAGHAVGRKDRRPGAAHIGPHPARMQHDGDQLGILLGKAAPHHVERRFRRTIDDPPAGILGDRAHAAADRHRLLLPSARELLAECPGERERGHRIDAEDFAPGLAIDMLGRHLAGPRDAGSGDETVDGLA